MSEAPDHGVHVTGSGAASGVPDVMVLNAGVEVTAADPGTAYQLARDAFSRLRQAAVDAGVQPRDLQSTQVDLRPTYDREGVPNGHQANLGLRIVVRDMSSSGAVIDGVTVGAGEYARLNGITLEHGDPTALNRQAREAALADARDKAETLARLSGRTLGRCVRIEELDGHHPGPMLRMASMDSGSMAVDGGEVEQAVSVATVWEFAD